MPLSATEASSVNNECGTEMTSPAIISLKALITALMVAAGNHDSGQSVIQSSPFSSTGFVLVMPHFIRV